MLWAKKLAAIAATTLFAISVLSSFGCDNKEKVLDVETPGGEVEIERDRDTGSIDVDVNDKD